MDRFVHDKAETIVFPGWGVPRELYFDAFEQTSPESVDIVDYGFFNDEESPLNTPIFDQEEDLPPVIVGHSMGALFAVRLALQNLEAVRRLILVNPFPKFVRDGTFPCGWKRDAVTAMRNGLRTRPSTVIRSFLRSCAMPEKYPGMFPETFNIQALDEGLAFIEESDIRAELELLTDAIPVFVLDGNADQIVNPEMTSVLADACSAVRHTFPGWGHLMLLQHPVECSEALREMTTL